MQATELTHRHGNPDLAKQRVAAVVRTLGSMKHRGGTLSEVVHDARNMVTALVLYCDLLSEPGVLSDACAHYADELSLIAAATRRLVEKLTLIDMKGGMGVSLANVAESLPQNGLPAGPTSLAGSLPDFPIDNLQKELLANRNLLDAVVGPSISISVRTEGGARPVRLTGADLTRVLINLIKNAAKAMHAAGNIEITLRDLPDPRGEAASVALLIEDSGPGIPKELLEAIFDPGYTTSSDTRPDAQDGGRPVTQRGLGLTITRQLIEAAGGRIGAGNRSQGGARITIELPVRTE